MESGIEPIEDDEILYRRVPASTGWYDPVEGRLKPEAFGPHRTQDSTGLSLARAKYKTIEEAAEGRPGKSYFVALLRAGDLRQRGIDVVPRPELPDGRCDPAHAELPDLNSATRKADITLERMRMLAYESCLRVQGPFATGGNSA